MEEKLKYTDKELKGATQIAYLDCIRTGHEALSKEGKKGPFSIEELIIANFESEEIEEAEKQAREDGVKEVDGKIPLKELVNFVELRDLDKSIITDEDFTEEMLDWNIINIYDQNHSNGLYACSIETSEKEAVIAFRGSENIKNPTNAVLDWFDADLGLLNNVETTQQKAVDEFVNQLLENGTLDKYESLAVTGHSLGGNLASHFTICAAKEGGEEIFEKIEQSVNFDGPGVSDEYIKTYEDEIEKASGKLTHYKWSPVGDLLFEVPGENVEWLEVDKEQYNNPGWKDVISTAIDCVITKDIEAGLADIKDLSIDKFKGLFLKHHTDSIMFDEQGHAIEGKEDKYSAKIGDISRGADKKDDNSKISALVNKLEDVVDIVDKKFNNNEKREDYIVFEDTSSKKFDNLAYFIEKTSEIVKEIKEKGINTIKTVISKIGILDVIEGMQKDKQFKISSVNDAIRAFNKEREKGVVSKENEENKDDLTV